MAHPDKSREEALQRLDARADALAARTARPVNHAAAHGQAVSQAYRIIVELFGGVLVGLALGFGLDRLFGIAPWGLIGGVLAGFAVALWMAKRTADRLTAQASREQAVDAGPAGPSSDIGRH